MSSRTSFLSIRPSVVSTSTTAGDEKETESAFESSGRTRTSTRLRTARTSGSLMASGLELVESDTPLHQCRRGHVLLAELGLQRRLRIGVGGVVLGVRRDPAADDVHIARGQRVVLAQRQHGVDGGVQVGAARIELRHQARIDHFEGITERLGEAVDGAVIGGMDLVEAVHPLESFRVGGDTGGRQQCRLHPIAGGEADVKRLGHAADVDADRGGTRDGDAERVLHLLRLEVEGLRRRCRGSEDADRTRGMPPYLVVTGLNAGSEGLPHFQAGREGDEEVAAGSVPGLGHGEGHGKDRSRRMGPGEPA